MKRRFMLTIEVDEKYSKRALRDHISWRVGKLPMCENVKVAYAPDPVSKPKPKPAVKRKPPARKPARKTAAKAANRKLAKAKAPARKRPTVKRKAGGKRRAA